MQTAAFFDMDKTLLRVSTGSRWIRYLRRRGEISTMLLVKSLYWTVQYQLSILDMETVATRLAGDMAGDLEEELLEKTREFVKTDVLPEVAPRALERLAFHREAGHLLVILTSSTPYVAEPLARHLGIEHVICTRLHVRDGRFVGTCDKPTCYGAGKVHHAERFAEAHGVDLARSFFYTDSYSDLPMLERVGERRVINPDGRLLRHARRMGWAVDRW